MNTSRRHPAAGENVLRRLWIYQADRFPIGKTALLLAVFSAASISVSAHLAGRDLPSIWTFVGIWMVVLIIFFQLRACDEFKDLEDDTRYRPERPIPSSLVSLRLILSLAAIAGIAAIVLAGSVYVPLIVILFGVWVWLGLMTVEFFVPEWLKARPVLYLVSHMAIMPLIDLLITAAEWMPYGAHPPQSLWLFLCLSFVNGCVLEIGRKVWAPQNERAGVETYSGLLGTKRAALMWAAACGLAWVLLVCVGRAVGAPFAVAIPGVIALIIALGAAFMFVRNPSDKGQKLIDTIAGLWVLTCYSLAGFAPFFAEVLSS